MHRVTVEISGKRYQAFLLVSIDRQNVAGRNVLLFSKPNEIIGLLPPHIKTEWNAFSRELDSYRQQWRFGAVPALKRVDRMYRADEILNDFELATVAHHFGAVPALIIGRADSGKWYMSNAQGSGCSSCTVRGNLLYQYDSVGNVLSATDELGDVTSYTYDSSNDVASITQPAVASGTPTTTYTYNNFGEVLTATDPLGHVTTNTYDSHGNLTSVATPVPSSGASASVTQFAYNSLGELTQITDPLNHVTAITYTAAGYIASITDPQNNVTSYGYDARGNRISVTDALSHTTAFTYDAGNRLTQITYPDTTTASFTYDYRGRRVTATDQNGNAIRLRYGKQPREHHGRKRTHDELYL